jgi:hypothetical protein
MAGKTSSSQVAVSEGPSPDHINTATKVPIHANLKEPIFKGSLYTGCRLIIGLYPVTMHDLKICRCHLSPE